MNAVCELSDEKTRITHVRDGFDFLGFHLVLGVGQKWDVRAKDPSTTESNHACRAEAQRGYALSATPGKRCNPNRSGDAVIRGWSNYYRVAHDFSRAASMLDHQAFWMRPRRYAASLTSATAQCLRRYRTGVTIGMSENCMLLRAQDTKMVYHLRSPDPYRPGTGCYLEDLDWEVDFQIFEGRRPGRMDSKVLALFRDGNRCRKCGVSVTYEDSEVDHMRPVNSFANFQQANFVTNLQTSVLECHGEKTAASAKKHLESRMLGNLHVRFGVGAGVRFPGPHHNGSWCGTPADHDVGLNGTSHVRRAVE